MRNVKQMRCTKQIGLFAFFLLPVIQPFTMQATTNKQTSILQQTDEKRTGERLLSGNVTDKGNEPLIGVTVQINGMKRNAITNAEGRYRLYIPQGTCKVTFSYVGMKSQTISFNGGSESLQQNIVMHEDKQLDEVVVTGFYTRSKQTFTGAAKTYNGEELRGVSPTNILQALSVLDAGISITQNNAMGSNPNNLPDLVIRSTTSLATDNEAGLNTPLIVIDGVEQSLQALYDIDINDIERVDILKDASATSLYGENAANGVIVVERKRVSQSPVKVRYALTPVFSFADLSSYDLCNAAQKLELERLAGLYQSNSGSLDQTYFDKLAWVSSGINTDWISKAIRNSFSHTHSLSVSGRGQGLDYNVNGTYSDKQGVMKADGRTRYGMNVYLSYRAVKNLILTVRAGYDQVDVEHSKYGAFTNYTEANPYDSPFDSHGNLRRTLSFNQNNPLYEASLSSFSKSETRTTDISLDLRYNFKPNLYITAQGSYSSSRGTSDAFTSPESNLYTATTDNMQKGLYRLGNTGSENQAAKMVGNWIHHVDDDGTMLTVNAGGEIKKQRSYSRMLSATGFLSDGLNDISYASSYPAGKQPEGSEDIATSVGAFVSANFVWKMRYFVDGSYRLSGSSKFGANNRYAPFWSAGMGYNLHNEDFIKKLGWVNSLRLRGSYGYTGSVKFSSYQAVTTYHYSNNYLHYSGVGAIPYGMSNPDLTWQTTKKMNIGLTSSLLGERLNINFDYYREMTDDMLIDMSLPPSSGATSVKSNIGRQKSNGYEFSVWAKLLDKNDKMWSVSVNGLHRSTTILGISDALKRWNSENAKSTNTAAPRLQYREGESPTAIYAVRSAGIDPASGKEIFIKTDGSYTYTYDVKDQVNCGDATPTLQGSISSQFRYKRFLLSVNFSYRFGGKMYNTTRAAKIENIDPQKNADIRAFTERWSRPGDVVPYLNISTTGGKSYVYTDRFVEKDNEFWFSGLQLRYDIPGEWAKKVFAERAYLSVGTQDLFRLTSAKYERGTAYPYSRDVNFTLNIAF
ncbi:SusC/RagA family TonB-linked outer membrane protein [Hoylesella saccharolytica]|uniref:SusC/RagA family TonB-linked outer membrane protein n=1 Tax=Hoylesella saccharolytica TaxID=633701 RepID=UPI0028D1E532|nr:SusC/RagA family TonB-linked outer membrane protein [Hoylesella saccharolytica]